MRDLHFDRLDSFGAFLEAIEKGSPVSPVDSDDLRRLHEMTEYVSEQHPGSDEAISIDLMAGVCSSEANVPAVWFRHAQLRSLVRQGILIEWQHGTELDDAVYMIAATIPMNGFQFDQLEFLQRLRYKAAA